MARTWPPHCDVLWCDKPGTNVGKWYGSIPGAMRDCFMVLCDDHLEFITTK